MGSNQSLAGRSPEPRIITRSEVRYVEKSSPREPYLSFNTGPHPLRRLIIRIWAHDQGQYGAREGSSESLMNSRTWFALGIIASRSDPSQPPDEPYLCEIQRNVRASLVKQCRILEWQLNTPFEGGQSDEDEAQGMFEEARSVLDQIPNRDPKIGATLNQWAIDIGQRYEQTNSIQDLTGAIELSKAAIEAMPDNHPKLAGYFGNVGEWLNKRYYHTRSIDDLSEAILAVDTAISMTPDGDPILVGYYNNSALRLRNRYDHTQSANDLVKGIEMYQKAIQIVEGTSSDHPELVNILDNLGSCLAARYQDTGRNDDLAGAFEVFDRIVKRVPRTHPKLSRYLCHLGILLHDRFQYTGLTDDLERAIEVIQGAIDNTPSTSSIALARYLTSMGQCLNSRSIQGGSTDDLDKAIGVMERAIAMIPEKHPEFAVVSSNLATVLRRKSDQHSLARAIEIVQKAIGATGDNHVNLAKYWGNLERCFTMQYYRTKSMDDLTRAIEASRKAVKATHHDNLHLASYFSSLGDNLGRRFARTRAEVDEDEQLSAYVSACQCTSSPPSARILPAKRATNIHTSRGAWDKGYDLLREAVLLLPKLSPRSLKQSDMQEMLSPASGLATEAATVALNAGRPLPEVLSILELGRGVIAGHLIDSRGDLSHLREKHPSLADTFEGLRKELDASLHHSGSMAELSMVNRRHQASREFDDIIERIRAQDGFHDFLQPPSAESLMAAADSGPIVVINVNHIRCDAILVERHRIRLLQFPGLTLGEIEGYVKGISVSKHNPWSLLEWLWTTICRPSLDALGFREPIGDEQWPHVWWVPTGPLSQLPLHAAGIYKQGSKETVLDRVVSSYASSIKALQHGRQRQRGMIDEHAQQSDVVLVAMEKTEGQMSLPNAGTEIDKVKALCPSLHLNALTPPRRKVNILEHLKNCKILHFAGHGESRMNPSESRLILDDWETDPLTVGDLRGSWLQESPAFLAYLSACSTGSNQGEGLSDEAIHLVSAFQLAGFRHVVGTLWEVSDPHCVDVATVLYQTLCDEGMTDKAVSYGLHRAVRKLRDDGFREGGTRDIVLVGDNEEPTPGPSVNTFWIPYIHYGA
ncbi:unnamed protein product [Fusarium equiseti]|uniref:CHAT domain-containing protein n=1 Tax=Fusarium equiseti TaxID=61235 RepID=A0A8J2NCX0_FUSEQ|nr:unnamed protein product [Fusarium equiseti]